MLDRVAVFEQDPCLVAIRPAGSSDSQWLAGLTNRVKLAGAAILPDRVAAHGACMLGPAAAKGC
jgi:hypothetical protein